MYLQINTLEFPRMARKLLDDTVISLGIFLWLLLSESCAEYYVRQCLSKLAAFRAASWILERQRHVHDARGKREREEASFKGERGPFALSACTAVAASRKRELAHVATALLAWKLSTSEQLMHFRTEAAFSLQKVSKLSLSLSSDSIYLQVEKEYSQWITLL